MECFEYAFNILVVSSGMFKYAYNIQVVSDGIYSINLGGFQADLKGGPGDGAAPVKK